MLWKFSRTEQIVKKRRTNTKRFISNIIAKCIIADAKRKGKRPPPFEGTRALVEQQSWKKIIYLSAKSTAGPKGGYIAKAKAVSNDIADVLPNSPTPGEVRIYVLMEDGTIAGQEVKNAVLAACNADETRPLTDHVLVEDPETVAYDIDVTYYLNRGGPSAADVQSEVNAAVDTYVKWQAGKLGRDINPSELTRRMMVNGVKRVVIRSPVYTELRSGNVATDASGRVALADLTDTVPQVGKLRGRTVTSGGYEDE